MKILYNWIMFKFMILDYKYGRHTAESMKRKWGIEE